MNSNLRALNRAHIKPFLQYYNSRKLRLLARRVMRSRRKDILNGQFLMFNDIRDRTFSGYLI